MDIETLRLYCLAKAGTDESFPFDEETLVFKVMGKIFAIAPLEKASTMNLKCDPAYALELREHYPESIKPGFHMNKKHWNTVHLDYGLDRRFLESLIDHSYELVVAKLTKAQKEELKQLASDL